MSNRYIAQFAENQNNGMGIGRVVGTGLGAAALGGAGYLALRGRFKRPQKLLTGGSSRRALPEYAQGNVERAAQQTRYNEANKAFDGGYYGRPRNQNPPGMPKQNTPQGTQLSLFE